MAQGIHAGCCLSDSLSFIGAVEKNTKTLPHPQWCIYLKKEKKKKGQKKKKKLQEKSLSMFLPKGALPRVFPQEGVIWPSILIVSISYCK